MLLSEPATWENCPTCGSPVKIETGEDGTAFYIPQPFASFDVADAELLAKVMRALDSGVLPFVQGQLELRKHNARAIALLQEIELLHVLPPPLQGVVQDIIVENENYLLS